MLQKLFMRTIGITTGAGLLGMVIVCLVCARIDGAPLRFGAMLALGRPLPEEAAVDSIEAEKLRDKIFAGGCAGLLIGLAVSAGISRRSP